MCVVFRINELSTSYMFEEAYFVDDRLKLGCITTYSLNPIVKVFPVSKRMPVVDVPIFV